VDAWGIRQKVETRLQAALAEAELALRFLEEGLHRNAAGRAFQAWKAALAAAAALARDELLRRYRGKVATREDAEVELADWLIALMPTGRMWEVARDLRQSYGDEVVLLTALNLHEVQHNGLDESGVLSKYSTLQQVKEDVKELAQRTAEFAETLKQRLNP
jgi:predicted dinucleotide-binding enzyme